MGRFVFKLPDVGEGTAEAELVAWHVAVGDLVEEDQIVADIMTDKATVEITAPVSGKVLAIHGEPGQMVPVRGPLVEFEVEGAGNAADAEPTPAPVAAEPEPAPVAVEAPKAEAAPVSAPAAAGANYVFKLPDVGEGTAEAELVGWHVKVGDAVEEDQIVAEIMTDKATVELTSPVTGTVVALHGEAGQQLPVGGPLVRFQVEGKGNVAAAPAVAAAPVAKAEKAAPAPVAKAAPVAATKAEAKPVPAMTGRQPGERALASPAVRNRARDLGIDLAFVPGSGPAGRIQHEDLDAFVSRGGSLPAATSGAPSSTYARAEGATETKIIGLRRKIAEKMAESVRRIPHITYVEEIDMTAVEELRAHLNATKAKDQPKLNVLPFIARAIIVALRDQPTINSHYDDEAGVLTTHAPVHLGIAAQTPNGLMVPVVRHAEALDPYATALEIARVSGAAKDGSAKREELSGSTITITSLGTLGGVVHTPIINHPEVAIVGPNKIAERVVAKDGSAKREELSGSTITITSLGTLGGVVHTPIINHPEVAIVGPNKIAERVVVKDGQMVVRKMMNLSSSFDHRIVDGHDAAVFVARIKGLLENPATLWMN